MVRFADTASFIKPNRTALAFFASEIRHFAGATETSINLQSIIVPGAKVKDGLIVEAVAIPWTLIANMFAKDRNIIFTIDPRKMEELIAASYKEAGFDEVLLTPRSGDFGRDIIAVKKGFVTIRIIDSVKAYKPGHLVDADDVRALLGVLSGEQNTSKGVVTTTSDFAPRIKDDPFIKPFLPYRLELINGRQLTDRLIKLAN
jgi:restriction system protein